MKESKMARIVPPANDGGGATKSQGTRIFVGEEELGGVCRVELVAGLNDVWQATIHCHAYPTDITADSQIFAPSLWQRLRVWILGGSGIKPRAN